MSKISHDELIEELKSEETILEYYASSGLHNHVDNTFWSSIWPFGLPLLAYALTSGSNFYILVAIMICGVAFIMYGGYKKGKAIAEKRDSIELIRAKIEGVNETLCER